MRKLIRHRLPCPDSLREQRCFSLFGNTLLHPRLWHLNRHSAAGGLAVGLFCSLIPGPLQMLGAGILCVYFRVNLPLALIGTWFSNPFTIVPLYIAAVSIGGLFSTEPSRLSSAPEIDWTAPVQMFQAWWEWFLSLGQPLLIGLPLLALLLAALGYFAVKLIWEFWLRRSWHKRCTARQHRSTPDHTDS